MSNEMIEHILSIETQYRINSKVKAYLQDDQLKLLDGDQMAADIKTDFINKCVNDEIETCIHNGDIKQQEHDQDILIIMKFSGNLCSKKYIVPAKIED